MNKGFIINLSSVILILLGLALMYIPKRIEWNMMGIGMFVSAVIIGALSNTTKNLNNEQTN